MLQAFKRPSQKRNQSIVVEPCRGICRQFLSKVEIIHCYPLHSYRYIIDILCACLIFPYRMLELWCDKLAQDSGALIPEICFNKKKVKLLTTNQRKPITATDFQGKLKKHRGIFSILWMPKVLDHFVDFIHFKPQQCHCWVWGLCGLIPHVPRFGPFFLSAKTERLLQLLENFTIWTITPT